jgi:hypothetical protein
MFCAKSTGSAATIETSHAERCIGNHPSAICAVDSKHTLIRIPVNPLLPPSRFLSQECQYPGLANSSLFVYFCMQ